MWWILTYQFLWQKQARQNHKFKTTRPKLLQWTERLVWQVLQTFRSVLHVPLWAVWVSSQQESLLVVCRKHKLFRHMPTTGGEWSHKGSLHSLPIACVLSWGFFVCCLVCWYKPDLVFLSAACVYLTHSWFSLMYGWSACLPFQDNKSLLKINK